MHKLFKCVYYSSILPPFIENGEKYFRVQLVHYIVWTSDVEYIACAQQNQNQIKNYKQNQRAKEEEKPKSFEQQMLEEASDFFPNEFFSPFDDVERGLAIG